MVWRRQAKLHNYYMPEEKLPVCPHCDEEVDGLMSRRIETNAGRGYVWTCPKCLVIIGISHRSGYMLG